MQGFAMNIPNPVKLSAASPVAPEKPEATLSALYVRNEQTEAQAEAADARDRFTPSDLPVRNALYDVTRVRSGQHPMEAPETVTEKTLSGEVVSRKMADILLATGRNLLHIYQMDTDA
jgi:hypothetical protein